MPQDNKNNRLRVLFCHSDAKEISKLSAELSAFNDFDSEEFVAPSDEIWKKAIFFSADVVLLFCPETDISWERCVRRILRGAFSHVLLLTAAPVESKFLNGNDRVDIRVISADKSDFEDVFLRIRQLGKVKKSSAKPPLPPPPFKKPERKASVTLGSDAAQDPVLGGKIVAVGASTGGTDAIDKFFHGLSPKMPGIVVVQHMPPIFTAMFADRLNRELPFTVVEAEDHMPILPGHIYIAPGDHHLRIKKIGNIFYTIVGGEDKVNGHCPSVDILFDSVAEVAGSSACGVILTGMGGDGARGLLKMKQRGAFTIGQDEESSVVYGMPKKAFDMGAVMVQAPLSDIAGILMKQF